MTKGAKDGMYPALRKDKCIVEETGGEFVLVPAVGIFLDSDGIENDFRVGEYSTSRFIGEIYEQQSRAFIKDIGNVKAAALDWDGTISRIREGWEGIMVPVVAAMVQGIVLSEEHWEQFYEHRG